MRATPRGASCAERAAAAARLFRVRVVKDKTLREQRSVVVERRALQEEQALAVNEQFRAVRPFEYLVAQPLFRSHPNV